MVNLEKFFIIENKNGKKSQESYLKDNFNDLHKKIINFNKKNLNDISFKEKIWHYIHNIDIKVLCKKCDKELKFKRTISEGYGVYCSRECTNQCEEHIKKVKETSDKKYGGQGTSSESINDKIKNTTLKNFGVDNFFKRKDLIQDKFIEKYNVPGVWAVEGVSDKIKNTNIKKIGLTSNLLTKESQYKSLETKRKVFREKYERFNILSDEGDDIKILCDKCQNEFTINRSVLYNRNDMDVEVCTNCNPVTNSISYSESEVLNYIKELLPLGEIKEKDRKVIYPQEIDVLIPNKNIGIEYNGLFWHSSYKVTNDYHFKKYKKCSEQNIKLIQIFEDEWLHKKEIVKSILNTNFNVFDQVIYGRKCVVKEIDNKVCKEFVDQNHIQGHHNSKIKIGLFYDDKLVSVMTFGSLRKSLGMKSVDGSYEMVRFCNLKNTKVIGGGSKLFKYFLKTYQPSNIISFSDSRYFTGELYEKLGFTFNGETKPNYHYIKGGKRINRFNYRKDVLVSMGYDKNKSEREITEEMGLLRIYDCGCKKWVYNHKTI